jgi:hypothetical protein
LIFNYIFDIIFILNQLGLSMKLKSMLFFLVISFNSLFSIQLDQKEQDILSKVAVILKSSHTQKQNEVWPGYDLTQSPVVITFKNGHIFVFNMRSENRQWQKLALNGFTILYSTEDHWGLTHSAFQPQFPLEGQKAYVFNLENATGPQAIKSYQVLVHERFHRHEFENFQVNSGANPYADHLNGENLALGKLEEQILADFMKDQGNVDSRMEHLRNFIAVNAVRRSLIKPSSIEWEDHQQIMEGLADYVSYKIMDIFNIVPFEGHQELGELLDKEAANTDYSDHAIKWRHYSLGASLGYVLDFLKVSDWKMQVENGQKNLSQMIQEAVGLPPGEIAQRFENCKAIYQWDHTFATVSLSVNKFEEEVANHIKNYQQMEGNVLEIGRPRMGLSGSGSNLHLFYLADGSTLSLQDTLSSSSEDNLWRLTLDHMPYVFKTGSGAVKFKVDKETEIIVDNQKFTLKELLQEQTRKSFMHIEIQGKNSHFVSDKHEGLLTVNSRGTLNVSF